ncbi:MAG: sulfotransferase [Flavobacteriales bacterium]|nr:sulfotransferase [Flavobacteriales bacterium]
MGEIRLLTIQSVPRSGSSWLGQIFKSSPEVAFRFQPLFSYAFKDRLTPQSTREECLRFFEEIRFTRDPFVLQRDPNIHVDYPSFAESTEPTHVVMKEVRYNHILPNLMAVLPEIRVVGLVRHPCAVIDSWIHAPREFKPEWSVQEQWRSGALKNQGRPEEFFGFDKWKEVALLFLQLQQQYPDRMKVVRYADLNDDPVATAHDLFRFCALEFGPSTEAFITSSRSADGNDANSVYRKVRADEAWQGRLDKTIATTILNELANGPLARFL